MERREFLKLFGLGAAAVGVAAATMTPAQAASAAVTPPAVAPSVDDFIKDLAKANGDEGEFAQYYYVRRRRYYRPRYYYRPIRRRRCWLRATPWGWRRVCA